MWDIRYRPVKFSDVLGQKGAVHLLKARLKKKTALDTSYIFSGGHGQGKTTLARILARAALCQDFNTDTLEPCNVCEQCQAILNDQPSAFEERDAASGGTINIVRSMLDDLPFSPPMNAPRRVWLFDEAHRLGVASQDALLKPIEEKKVVMIFCTTEAEAIRGPIRSRCEEHVIRKVTREDVLERMQHILRSEGVEFQDDAVLTVIDHAGGHIRDVVNRLEMISQSGPITVESVREFLHLNTVTFYYQILLALGDAKKSIDLIEQVCERVTPEEVAAGLAEAAMNSYRLANNLAADFSYVDKPMAAQVFQMYGAKNLFGLAEFFLRYRNISKTSLTFDVLTLIENNGSVPTPQTVTSANPPVVISAPVSVQATAATPTPPASVSVSTEKASVPVAPVVPVQTSIVKPMANGTGNGKLRPDGIGARGSGDPLALTDEDHNGVPQGQPRKQSSEAAPKLMLNPEPVNQAGIMSPEEWKREFTRTWWRGQ